jgi:hypothetical protein
LFRAAVTFGKGVPGRASRTGLAAAEYREKRIVRGHGVSLSLVPDGELEVQFSLRTTLRRITERRIDNHATQPRRVPAAGLPDEALVIPWQR